MAIGHVTMTFKIAIAFFCLNTASAQIILTDPRGFQSQTTLLDFEAFPNGESLPDYGVDGLGSQWSSTGVVLNNPSPGDGVARWRSTGPEIPSHSGTNGVSRSNPAIAGGSLDFLFVNSLTLQPAFVTEAGVWVQNGYSFPIGGGSVVTFFDVNNSPIYSSEPTTSFDQFIGLRFASGISRIQISDPDYFLADDLQFGPVLVPEPNTSLLLLLAAVGWLVFRTRLGANSAVDGRRRY